MKGTVVVMAVLGSVLICSAVTIKYRDGHAMVCDVLAKDDTNLIVRTVKGVQTNTWRQLTAESFKAVHPELYARLLATAQARQKEAASATSAVPLRVVAAPAAAAPEDLRKIGVGVDTELKVGNDTRVPLSKTMKKLGWSAISKRECHGCVELQLRGLHVSRLYRIRAAFTVYLKGTRRGDLKRDSKFTQKKSGTAALTLTNQAGARLYFLTQPYTEERWRTAADTAWVRMDADYWDVSI